MYQREIIYLSFVNQEIKEKNAGFCRIERKQEFYYIELQIKKMENYSGTFPVRIQTINGWKEIGKIEIASGTGSFLASIKEEMHQIEIRITKDHKITGQSKMLFRNKPVFQAADKKLEEKKQVWEKEKPEEKKQVREKEPPREKEQVQEKEQPKEKKVIYEKEPEKSRQQSKESSLKNNSEIALYEDKWEQLLTTYEKIHPYGDERTYIKLEPKDFVILRANYQHLVNNSFLLHGFYNYRYLILGKEKDFYLGVPGVFYEREKMVALMFGFEAFECEGGAAEEGKFGYYLRKVEL